VHLHRSAGGGRCQSESDPAICFLGDPEDISMYHQEAIQERLIWYQRPWWAGVSFPSLATWPKRLSCFLTNRFTTGGSAGCSVISVLQIWSCHEIPRICIRHFMCKDSRLLVSVASGVHVYMCIAGLIKRVLDIRPYPSRTWRSEANMQSCLVDSIHQVTEWN